jgi:FkbM family methyltransferase
MSIGRWRVLLGRGRIAVRLERLRNRLWDAAPGSEVDLAGMRLRITDGPNAFMQYKDEFVRRNYAFKTSTPAPFVIDGGANMGMFTLSTLRDHPGARITAFEPDPAICALLRANLAANSDTSVTVVNAAIGAREGTMAFAPDGRAGGALQSGDGAFTVNVVPLSRYIDADVDFLKLNIEGAELDVLTELEGSGRLSRVRAMVLEYHGWHDGEQKLGPILSLLDRNGFRYMIHDMDAQTNPVTKPPFMPPPEGAPWFALVYAWQAGR